MKTNQTLTSYRAAAILLGIGMMPLHAAIIQYNVPSDGTIAQYTQLGNSEVGDSVIASVLAGSSDVQALFGGSVLLPNLTANFSSDKTFEFLFTAPSGYQFDVTPPTWAGAKGGFTLLFGSQGSTPVDGATASFEWLGVVGTAPTVAYHDLSVIYSDPAGLQINAQGKLIEPFSFTGFKATITVPDAFDSDFNDVVLNNSAIMFQSVTSLYEQPLPDAIVMLSPVSAIPEPGNLLALGCLVGTGAFLRSRKK